MKTLFNIKSAILLSTIIISNLASAEFKSIQTAKALATIYNLKAKDISSLKEIDTLLEKQFEKIENIIQSQTNEQVQGLVKDAVKKITDLDASIEAEKIVNVLSQNEINELSNKLPQENISMLGGKKEALKTALASELHYIQQKTLLNFSNINKASISSKIAAIKQSKSHQLMFKFIIFAGNELSPGFLITGIGKGAMILANSANKITPSHQFLSIFFGIELGLI